MMSDVAVNPHTEPLFTHAPRQWMWIWGAGLLVATALSTVVALSSAGSWSDLLEAPSTPDVAVLTTLVLLWSAAGITLERWAFRTVTGRLLFVAVSWGLFFWISALNTDYSFLMYAAVLQTFIFLPSAWAIPTLLAFGLCNIGRGVLSELLSGRILEPWDILGPLALLSCLVMVMRYIQRANRESAVRQILIEQLAAAQQQLAAREHAAGIANERARLSRDLHDTLAQHLISVVTQLSAAELALAQKPEDVHLYLRRAQQTARTSLSDIRNLVGGLRPNELQGGQTELALRRVLHRWSDEAGMQSRFQLEGQPIPLGTQVDVALLRCLQETLSNVSRHARATTVEVSLTFSAEVVTLAVQDDGVGFDPDLPDSAVAENGHHLQGVGLRGMRERSMALGGRTLLESAGGQGTKVLMALPIRHT